jgi:hypothetical protein
VRSEDEKIQDVFVPTMMFRPNVRALSWQAVFQCDPWDFGLRTMQGNDALTMLSGVLLKTLSPDKSTVSLGPWGVVSGPYKWRPRNC